MDQRNAARRRDTARVERAGHHRTQQERSPGRARQAFQHPLHSVSGSLFQGKRQKADPQEEDGQTPQERKGKRQTIPPPARRAKIRPHRGEFTILEWSSRSFA